MATIGRLLGLAPPDVKTCRVLELACGDGGNLIPMALELPEAHFEGLDLAAEPVAAGTRVVRELGLRNVRLRQGNVLGRNAVRGKYDYIITHGLYSWAPVEVRDAILRISSKHLSPNGIAYVSYNALPGGRLRQMLRETMLFHASSFDDPMEKARQARAMLSLIVEGRTREDAFNALVREEVARMTDRDLWYLFHDELAEVYEPVYLHQFVGHAKRYDLQYLGDANFYNLQPSMLTEDAQSVIAELAGDDPVLREQYVDFVQCRRFHHSLLCKSRQKVSWPPTPERLHGLWASSQAVEIADGEFKTPLGAQMRTQLPVAKRVMRALIKAWPCGIQFRRPAEMEILLATSLSGLTDLRTTPLPVTNKVSARPVASPLVRYQAARGLPLISLTHATVEATDPEDLHLLASLDGRKRSGDRERLKRFVRLGLLMS